MIAYGGMLKRSSVLRALAVFGFAAIVIAARRWTQLVGPDVWVEDGTIVLPSFVKEGWAGLFHPVNGYLIVPSKLTSDVALTLSFAHYAIVSTILAIGAQAGVVVVIAFAPTILAAPVLAALLVPILPIGSEVYGLPLFVFWWTTTLLFVGLFWKDGRSLAGRLATIVIGGLSSPFVVAAWPIFALRAAMQRTRGNVIAFVASLAVAAIQGYVMVRDHATGATPPVDALHHLPDIVRKYFGTALYTVGQHGAEAFGIAVIVFLAGAMFALPKERRIVYVMLGMCLAVAVLTSIARVPVGAPHPLLAGPRYFFFPLILTGWMLIMIAKEGHRTVALCATLIVGAYAPSLAAAFHYDPQVSRAPWPDQVAACVASPSDYTFDIQLGRPDASWHLTLSGDDCRALQAGAYFDRHSPDGGKTAPAGAP